MRALNSFSQFSRRASAPFFIIGAPGSELVGREFGSIIKNVFGLEFHGVIAPSVRRPTGPFLFGAGSGDRSSGGLARVPLGDKILPLTSNFGSSLMGLARPYRFSEFYAYSILLEDFTKDFCVASQLNLVYFQFFHFINGLERSLQLEFDADSDVRILGSDLLDFCNFIYFTGFGGNLLVTYSDFRVFVSLISRYIEDARVGSNSIFIFNFIFNFFSKIFNRVLFV